MRSLTAKGPEAQDSETLLRWEKMRNAEVEFCQKIFNFLDREESYHLTDLEELSIDTGQECFYLHFDECDCRWRTFYDKIVGKGLL